MAAPRLALLDRDGVINADSTAFIRQPSDWQPLPGSLEAIALLCAAGWRIGVCTNQSGLARGLLAPADLNAIHERMRAAINNAGGHIDGIYVCPHGPRADCPCRKPAPGLLHRAISELGGCPARTWFVGDSTRDIAAARRAAVNPVLVLTGNGRRTQASLAARPPTYADLRAAATALIADGDSDA